MRRARRARPRREQAAWWSDAAGIPPGAGVSIARRHGRRRRAIATLAGPAMPARAVGRQGAGVGDRVHAGVAATRAGLPRARAAGDRRSHGADDGLVPEAFSGGAYAAAGRKAAGRDVRYWRVPNAQHFDAFLGLPMLAGALRADAALRVSRARRDVGASRRAEARCRQMRHRHAPRALTAAGFAPLTADNLGQLP